MNEPTKLQSVGCNLGCTTECKAKLHGVASECPALPWQPPAVTEPIKLPPIPDGTTGWYTMHNEQIKQWGRLAVEQATADLRRERNEARAELARLTTLRPIASLPPNTQCLRWTQSRTGQHWMLVDKHDWHDFWTPLPPVKEADK